MAPPRESLTLALQSLRCELRVEPLDGHRHLRIRGWLALKAGHRELANLISTHEVVHVWRTRLRVGEHEAWAGSDWWVTEESFIDDMPRMGVIDIPPGQPALPVSVEARVEFHWREGGEAQSIAAALRATGTLSGTSHTWELHPVESFSGAPFELPAHTRVSTPLVPPDEGPDIPHDPTFRWLASAARGAVTLQPMHSHASLWSREQRGPRCLVRYHHDSIFVADEEGVAEIHAKTGVQLRAFDTGLWRPVAWHFDPRVGHVCAHSFSRYSPTPGVDQPVVLITWRSFAGSAGQALVPDDVEKLQVLEDGRIRASAHYHPDTPTDWLVETRTGTVARIVRPQ